MTLKIKNISVSFLSLLLGICAGFLTEFKASSGDWDTKSVVFLILVIILWLVIVSFEFFIVTEAERALERQKRRSIAKEEKETLESEIKVEELRGVLASYKRGSGKTLEDL